jgi:hypothetical protein
MLSLRATFKRDNDTNVQGWIRLVLGATFDREKDTEMAKVGKGFCWEQGAIEERTPKYPLADRDVVGSNVQKRKGHQNVQGQKRLSLGATSKRGKDTEMSIGR